MPPLLILSAVEPSADRLAAALVTALRARGPVVVRGIAGPACRAAGVEAIFPSERLGVMGAFELLGRLGALRAARRAVRDALPGATAFLGVDAPDFHLPLSRQARRLGVPAVGFVAPQVWAWRPGRVPSIEASLDRLLCLFPFEPALFPNLDARWVGHPVRDRVSPRDPASVVPDLYALLPGSRRQEWARHLGPFLAAAERLRALRAPQDTRFVVLVPPELPTPPLPAWARPVAHLDAIAPARGALTKSGTVTLELALLGVPQVVAYRAHPLTYALGRLLVRGVRHLALPNVLADRAGQPAPLPEHIQDLNPGALAQALLALPERQAVDLAALGPPGAVARAAAAVAEIWETPGRSP